MPLNTKIIDFQYLNPAPIDSYYPAVSTGLISTHTPTSSLSSANIPIQHSDAFSLCSIIYCVPSGRVAKVIPRRIYISHNAAYGLGQCLSVCSWCVNSNVWNASCVFIGRCAFFCTAATSHDVRSYLRKFSLTHGSGDIPIYNDVQYEHSCTPSLNTYSSNSSFGTPIKRLFAVNYSKTTSAAQNSVKVSALNYVDWVDFLGSSCGLDKASAFEFAAENRDTIYLEYTGAQRQNEVGLKLNNSAIILRGGDTLSTFADPFVSKSGCFKAQARCLEEIGGAKCPAGYIYLKAGDCITLNYSRNASFSSFVAVNVIFCGTGVAGSGSIFYEFGAGFIARAETSVILSYLIIEEAAT